MTILDLVYDEIVRWVLHFDRTIYVWVMCFGFISCAVFPYKYKYYYINFKDDPNATHEKTSEYTSPPALVRFRYQKIYFTVLIQDNEVLFGLEIPEGNTVKLIEKYLKIEFNNSEKYNLEYVQTDRSYAGPALPPNWAFDKNYPINKDGFGVLRGATIVKNWPLNKNVHFYASYYYRAEFPFGKGANGEITLPKLVINSKEYIGPRVQFEWREKLGVGSIGP